MGRHRLSFSPAGLVLLGVFALIPACGGSAEDPDNDAAVDANRVDADPSVCIDGTRLGTDQSCASCGDTCQSGATCVAGACKKPAGGTCSGDTECQTGICADGVCCDARCGGTCEKCNLTGTEGVCTPIPSGDDPEDECATEAATTCGKTGVCSGTASCQLFSAGTECAARSCDGVAMSNRPDTCDGMGLCSDAGKENCTRAFTCDASTGQCRTMCSDNAHCVAGFECQGGVCKLSQTGPCTNDNQCASGFCTDGICCERRCDGTCERCNVTGSLGFCLPYTVGSDPEMECAQAAASTCGQTGVCSGGSSCQLYPQGTECLARSCAGPASSNVPDLCSGTGVCEDKGIQTCGQYTCNATTGQCRTTCTGPNDCATNYECATGGVCRKVDGQPCPNGDVDCGSGFCADGVCCEGRCGGTCEKCNQTGRLGFCDPIAVNTDPEDECGVDPTSTCDRTGECSGNRTCQLYPITQQCAAPTCANNQTSNRADFCDGSGVCADKGQDTCGNYQCNALTGLCRTSCSVPTDCAGGYTCTSAGICKKDRGQQCSGGAVGDGECASGICADGVCCDGRCSGVCESCNLGGTQGTCSAIAQGIDPDGECATQSSTTCGTTGFCAGDRSCELYPNTTQCAGFTCASATTSNNRDFCSGGGACVDSGITNCGAFTCNAGNGQCRTACTLATSAIDCAAGFTCAPGNVCKKAGGAACSGGSAGDLECASGFCADGVCCENRCGGTCEKCNQTGRLGFCDAIANNTDPDLECPDDGAASCDRDGLCNGSRGCGLYSSGTQCLAASCASQSIRNVPDTCDGSGICADQGTQNCGAYACQSGACRTNCTFNSDCATGYSCSLGVCKKNDGQSCSGNSECLNNACCSNVCRNTTNDANNCGGCGTQCVSLNSTNTCVNSACSPACNSGFGQCDGNNNNGCEVQNSGYTNAPYQHDFGSHNCDAASGFICSGNSCTARASATTQRGRYYACWANEDSSCSAYTGTQFDLAVPAGVNYDLYITGGCSCQGSDGVVRAGACSSTRGAGSTDSIDVWCNENSGSEEDFRVNIEVRWVSGFSCQNYTITASGGGC